jgi:ADP-ribosylglycohydrolase
MQDVNHTLDDLIANLRHYSQLKREQGARGVDELLDEAKRGLHATIDQIRALADDPRLSEREPDDLAAIRALRPSGARRLGGPPDVEGYRERLAGAFLGRSAGCILGAPVEGWSVDRMEAWAADIGMSFPPGDYWTSVPDPAALRYKTTRTDAFTRARMKGIPVDDDLQFTLLGLLILEEAGPEFSTDDVARMWLKRLPFACTAEDVTLANLQRGVPPSVAGASGGILPFARLCFTSEEWPADAVPVDNPYYQWIGADIRSDPWGYVAPGWPERAAELAYNDAFLSHRRNGIYGAMYFSAAIAAAFAVDDPVEALRIGLTEIPAECSLSEAVRWALEVAPEIRTYRDANEAVAQRFPGMHAVHTINNACLTVWGITIGGTDLTRVISAIVAMGYDNDCTAATAGSIVGAVIGRGGIDRHWIEPFGNTMYSYLTGVEQVEIDDLLDRFVTQMERVTAG